MAAGHHHHDHGHDHHVHDHHVHDHHGHDHHHTAPSALAFALGLTAIFLVVELVGGLLTGSLALLADAGHMASDVGALAVAMAAARIAARPPDHTQTMGYQRAEVLGAALNGGALAVIAVWIAVEAVGRLAVPGHVHAEPMVAIAAVGLVVNAVVAWRLHGGEDLNRRAAFLHVLGDLLGSVGAITAGVLVWAFDFQLADPLISLGLAALLLVGSARVLGETSRVLMQAAPADADLPAIEQAILAVDGVVGIHALHVWSLRPGEDVVTVHVVVCTGTPVEAACASVRSTVHALRPDAHVTVQPEPESAPCAESA